MIQEWTSWFVLELTMVAGSNIIQMFTLLSPQISETRHLDSCQANNADLTKLNSSEQGTVSM